MMGVIGMMIGLYINLRGFSFLTRTGDRQESLLVRLMTGATILLNWVLMYMIWNWDKFGPRS